MTFVKTFKDSVESNLIKINPKQKHSYISGSTWDKIQERQTCREEGDIEKEKSLAKDIKSSAAKDKKHITINSLQRGISLKETWEGVKNLKRKHVPNFNKQFDIRGNRIPLCKRADATAEYLSEVQWNNSNNTLPKTNPSKVIIENLGMMTSKIESEEVR